jgi:exo-1,4-beta-D-glucosaminidase
MKKIWLFWICSFALLSPLFAQSTLINLREAWSLQSSAKVAESGAVLSTAGYHPQSWYTVTVPTTLVAALVKQGIYPDPDFGMNLRQIPGTGYPIGKNFSNLPMPVDSPFAVSWWYRKEFPIPADFAGKTVWLNFRGINYRANIWLNGKPIATSEQVAGAWRTYEFNVSSVIKPGAPNALAVEVFAPSERNLAITFVDWNPAPPDKNMGLWREVYLTTSGPVTVRDPVVTSRLDSGGAAAHLAVAALVHNASDQTVRGTLQGRIENAQFSQEVQLSPGEQRDIVFAPENFPQLNLSSPRLWWPAQMGTPNLYDLHLQFESGGNVSDASDTRFGVREIQSSLTPSNGRLFTINGKKLLIRGGGWTPDMMLRHDPQRMQDELRYVLDLGLNTVRLEGKLEPEDFFDLTDRWGILVMAGWCCCDHWEHWGNWRPDDFTVARESLQDQIYRLRGHPSLLVWLNGSDFPPPPDVEQMYLDTETQCRWPNPTVSSAKHIPTPITGDPGVKMSGPYEYVAPSYWLQDTAAHGGAFSFNTETSPGPAVPPVESLRRMLPADHLWPIDDWWNYHAGGGAFKDIHVFTDALNARYGPATGVDDYARKAQVLGYEGIRAMFEGYSRNKYGSTGIIQWMLNNAWPSTIWHLYDYYLRPGGVYFGAKKALEPLHPIYSYDDGSIWVINSRYQETNDLKLTAKVYDLNLAEKYSKDADVNLPADGSVKILTLPQWNDMTPVYFLDLRLQDRAGQLVGSNFYWLSTKPDTLDWPQSTWYYTPTASYADFTALAALPKVKLKVTSRTERAGEDAVTQVTVENPGKTLAFFVRLKVNQGESGQEILPVRWQDNYFSLLPGEKRGVTGTYRASQLGTAKPAVEVSGWNVE